jgi:HK97 family phage major capsid protein
MDPELKALMEKIQSEWAGFKSENDRRLKEVEKVGRADPLTEEKITKHSLAIGELEKEIKDLTLKTQRPGAGSQVDEQKEASAAHRKAFGFFVRKGKEEGLEELQQKAMSLTAGEGGYTIPQDLDTIIGQQERAMSPMLQEIGILQVGTETYEEPVSDGMAVSAWAAETGARAASTAPTFVKFTPSYGEAWANPQVTQRMLDDAKFDVETFLANDIGQSFGIAIDTAVISGTGTNQPKGVTAYTLAATSDATRAYGTIERVHSGGAGTFTADNLISLAYTLRPAYRLNAKWAAAPLTLATIRKFKDVTSGQYLWAPGIGPGQPGTLLGYPVIEDENVPAVAASAYSVLFADWKRAYRLVEVHGTQMLRDPYSAKPYVHFYCTKRVGGGVRDTRAIKALYLAV